MRRGAMHRITRPRRHRHHQPLHHLPPSSACSSPATPGFAGCEPRVARESDRSPSASASRATPGFSGCEPPVARESSARRSGVVSRASPRDRPPRTGTVPPTAPHERTERVSAARSTPYGTDPPHQDLERHIAEISRPTATSGPAPRSRLHVALRDGPAPAAPPARPNPATPAIRRPTGMTAKPTAAPRRIIAYRVQQERSMNTQDKRFLAAALGEGYGIRDPEFRKAVNDPAFKKALNNSSMFAGSFTLRHSREWPFAPHAGIRSMTLHSRSRRDPPFARLVLTASWGTGITGTELSVGLDLDLPPQDHSYGATVDAGAPAHQARATASGIDQPPQSRRYRPGPCRRREGYPRRAGFDSGRPGTPIRHGRVRGFPKNTP